MGLAETQRAVTRAFFVYHALYTYVVICDAVGNLSEVS